MDRWYAVYTKRHREVRANFNLAEQDYRVRLLMGERIIKHGPKHMHKLERRPLFARYVFVLLDLSRESCGPINGTDGVDHLVCTSTGAPIPIRTSEIELILAKIEQDGGYYKLDKTGDRASFDRGQVLRVTDGPFISFKGPVMDEPDKDKVTDILRLELEMFGGKVPVRVPYSSVEIAA